MAQSFTRDQPLDTDVNLGGGSPLDYIAASQKATKTYVDNKLATQDIVKVSKLVAADGSPDPALAADAAGALSTAYNLSLTGSGTDIFIAGDEAGVKQRATDIYVASITDHFDSTFTGWTWATYAGFGTPDSIDMSTYPSFSTIFNTGGVIRSFAYRSTYSSNISSRCSPAAGCRAGIRMDDGTISNYVELFLEDVSGMMKLRYRYAIGGVVTGPTDIWTTAMTNQLVVLNILRFGDLTLLYSFTNSPNPSYTGVGPTITGWTPSRSGIIYENLSGGANYGSAGTFDFYKQ